MKLYTSVDIAPSPKKIAYNDKILLLGSCFADNIGTKFGEYYFQTTVNPYGTLYNPASIAKAISGIGNGVSDIGIVEHNGLWHSLSHHGSFSRADKEDLVRACEQSRVQLREALQRASIMIITFGTAWVYAPHPAPSGPPSPKGRAWISRMMRILVTLPLLMKRLYSGMWVA